MSQVQSHFEDISAVIAGALAQAKTSIKVALAYFTDTQLFNLLCLKAEKGTLVQLIISDDEINLKSGIDFNKLTQAGGEVYFYVGSERGVLHHKFCVIDEDKVITGSYNWSQRAKSNLENIMVVSDDAANSAAFVQTFEGVREASTQLAYNRESYVVGSGISDFDKAFNGFHAGSQVVFCSPSNAELSSLALSIVNHVLQSTDDGVVYFSLNETEEDVAKRLLAIQDDLNYDAISRHRRDLSEYELLRTGQAAVKLLQQAEKRLHLRAMRYPSLDEFSRLISLRAMAGKAKLVVIDGTENMNSQDAFPLNNKFDALEPSFREIKRIALAKFIPVICLLHTPPLEKKRGVGLELRLNDLGLLAGISDTIYSVERPYDYFGINAMGEEEDGYNQNARNIVALKNRYGTTDRIKVLHNPVSKKFTDILSGGQGQFAPPAFA